MAGWPDQPRGFKAVDAPAGADVQDGLTGADRLQSGRRAATIGDLKHLFRDK